VFLDQFSEKKNRHKIEQKKRKKNIATKLNEKNELIGNSEQLKKSSENDSKFAIKKYV